MLECLRHHNNKHTLSSLYSELRGKNNKAQNFILLLINRILENVAVICGQAFSSYWTSKLNRVTIHSQAEWRHLPHKASSMKEQ